jgi:hypothetical protein
VALLYLPGVGDSLGLLGADAVGAEPVGNEPGQGGLIPSRPSRLDGSETVRGTAFGGTTFVRNGRIHLVHG